MFEKCACVRLRSESSEPIIRCFFKRRLTNTPRRHRLADGELSTLYLPWRSFSSFGASSAMLCCSARPASSSTPLRPSVCYQVVNTRYIRTFCDDVNALCIFDSTCIVLKSGLGSTARIPRLVRKAGSLILPSFLPSSLASFLPKEAPRT